MAEYFRRARQLELMKAHAELRQRKLGRQLRTIDDAIFRTERLAMQLHNLHLQYASQETSGGISALALASIRRKQAEMREAIEQQRERLEGLQSERAILAQQANREAHKVERITEMLEANATARRQGAEKKLNESVVSALNRFSESGMQTAAMRNAHD